MTTSTKKNMLFIHSDSDSDNNDPHQNSSIQQISASYKLQGSYRFQGDVLTKNILHQSSQIQDYQYQSPSPPKRRHKRFVSSIPQTGNVRSSIKMLKIPEQQPVKKNNLFDNYPTQQSSRSHKNQKNDEATQIQQIEESKSKQPPKTARQSKDKILKFQIEDSDEDSDDSVQNAEIRESIDKAIESKTNQEKEQVHQFKQEVHQSKQQVLSNKDQSSVKQKDTITKVTPVEMIEKSSKYLFNRKSLMINSILEGKIITSKKGFNYLYPQFDLSFTGYNTHIVSCKKQSGAIGANYYLSTEENQITKNQNYLGKLRSTSEDSVYNIFDNGDNQMKSYTGYMKKMLVATVCLYITSGPRNIEIFMLKDEICYDNLKGAIPNAEINLKKLFEIEENRDKIHYFRTKIPQLNQRLGKYVMNFNGKAKQASIRNTVIEDPQTNKKVLLIAKQKDNEYNIQILGPLKPWIALGVIAVQFETDD